METKGDRETKFETSKNFTDLLVWKKAHMFVLEVYQITQKYPDTERFALCSQFKRAAISIPANIAEGYKKLSKADKLRFMKSHKEVWKKADTTSYYHVTSPTSTKKNMNV